MSRTKIKVKMVKKILRLFFVEELFRQTISKRLGMPRSTVRDYINRAVKQKLTWNQIESLTDDAIRQRLFPERTKKITPEWKKVQAELKRSGVTLQLLWEEYYDNAANHYCYSEFCRLFAEWQKQNKLWLPHDHIPGEILYVDYAGHTIPYYDKETGEQHSAQIFVASLGASKFIFCEATASQSLSCWTGSHARAFSFFGGSTEIVVPDNLKSAVNKAHRYDPMINLTYESCANHYGVTIMPARVRTPKDKALAENAVQQVERRILAALRDNRFYSIAEINQAITPLLLALNQRLMKKYHASRYELFNKLDKPALKPLPIKPYEYSTWKSERVNGGYHICVDDHFYSVPSKHISDLVQIKASEKYIAVFYQEKRIALHLRDDTPFAYTTDDSHRPISHQKYLECNADTLLKTAKEIGEHTHNFIEQLLKLSKEHQKKILRRALGILNLRHHYDDKRLEAALAKAKDFHFASLHDVEAILKNGLEKVQQDVDDESTAPQDHEFIRGADYYDNNDEDN